MEKKALYDRFLDLLEEFHTTPYAVSKKAGISQPTLSDWKLGKSEPKRRTLEKICEAYGKDLSYFYMDDDKPENGYYVNKETAEIAQQIFERKELRGLFDTAKDSKPEDLKVVNDMLLALKRKENPENEGC